MGELRLSELSGSVGSARRWSGAAHGGSVRMFGIAAANGRCDGCLVGRPSAWIKGRPRDVALVGLGYAAGSRVPARPAPGSFRSTPGAVRVRFGCFAARCDFSASLWVKLFLSELLMSQ